MHQQPRYGAKLTASVHAAAGQNGESLVWAGDGEAEALQEYHVNIEALSSRGVPLLPYLAVVVGVGVVVAADLLAVLVVPVALVEGVADGGGGVELAAASGLRLALDEVTGGSGEGGDGKEQG